MYFILMMLIQSRFIAKKSIYKNFQSWLYIDFIFLIILIMYSKPLRFQKLQVERVIPRPTKQLEIIDKSSAYKKISNLRKKQILSTENQDQLLDEYNQLVNVLTKPSTIIAEVKTSKTHYKICTMSEGLLGGRPDISEKALPQDLNIQKSNTGVQNSSGKDTLNFMRAPLGQTILQKLQNLHKIQIPELKQATQIQKSSKVAQQNQIFNENEQSEIKELIELINRSIDPCAKTLGRDVVFLVGRTGSGKSTMVHYLNGIQIKDVANKDKKSSAANKAKLIITSPLEGFQVSDKKQAITKVINVSEIQNLNIVDTAGLSDTNGALSSIANAIGLEKSLHNSGSVRIFFLIQSQWIFDPRGQPLIDLITELIGYVKNISIQQFIPTVTIGISHAIYSCQSTIQELKRTHEGVQKRKTFENEIQKQKVKIFISSMIQSCNLLLKKQQISKVKEQIASQSKKIQTLKQQKSESGLQDLQRQIQELNEEISEKQNDLVELQELQNSPQKQEKKAKAQTRINSLKNRKEKMLKQHQKKVLQNKQTIQTLEIQLAELTRYQTILSQLSSENQRQIQTIKKTKAIFNNLYIFNSEKITNQQDAALIRNQLISSPRINNPKQCFQISIKNELKTKTEELVYVIKEDLLKSLKNKNFISTANNFSKISYLYKYIPTDAIGKAKEQCNNLIKQFVEQKCNKFRSTLDSLSEKGFLTSETITSLLEVIFILEEANDLIYQLSDFDQERNSYQGLSNYLIQKVQLTSKQLVQVLKQQHYPIYEFKIQQLNKIYFHFGYKYPKIASILKQIYADFTLFCSSQVKKAVNCIEAGEYENLLNHLNFLLNFNPIAKEHFTLDLDQKYQILIEKCKQSLKSRVDQGISDLKSKLSQQTSSQVKKQIGELKKFSENIIFQKKVTKKFLDQLYQNFCSFLVNECYQYIAQIKSLIKVSKLQEIKDVIFILKNLRQSDDNVTTKTSDQYIDLIYEIKNDIADRSIKTLNEIFKKIKQGICEDQDIESIKETLNKLEKLEWLKDFINSDKCSAMVIQANKILKMYAQNIEKSIQRVFYEELKQTENKSLLDQTYRQNSFLLSSIKKTGKFKKLNSSLKFMQQLSQINEQIKQMTLRTQTKVDELINKHLTQIERLVSQNLKQFQLHKIELDRWFSDLLAIRQIDRTILCSVEKKLQELQSITKKYLEDCIDNIYKLQIQQDEEFIKFVKTHHKIFKSLSANSSLDRITKNLRLQQYQQNLKQILHNKFFNLMEIINAKFRQENFGQCSKNIEILKKYVNSFEINEILNDQPKIQYNKYVHHYNLKVEKMPQNMEIIFTEKKYEDLIDIFTEYKSVGNSKNCRKMQNMIKNTMNKLSKQIEQDIYNLQFSTDKEIKQLNKKIKEFMSFEKLSTIVENYNWKQKQDNYISLIKNYQNQKKKKLHTQLSGYRFQLIKAQIQKYNRIYQLLIQGINYKPQDFKRQDFEKKLNQVVTEILEQTFNPNLKQCAQNLKQLQYYDLQYRSDFSTKYIKKIRLNLINECKHMNKMIPDLKKIQQLDDQLAKLQSLKFQFEDNLCQIPQLSETFNYFRQTSELLERQAAIIILQNKYDSSYLNRIKSNNLRNYQEIIQQLKAQYLYHLNQVKAEFQSRNFQNFSKTIIELKKFENMKDHEGIYHQQLKPKVAIHQYQEKVKKITEELDQKIRIFFSNDLAPRGDKAQNINNAKLYFNILKKIDFHPSQDRRFLNHIRATHVLIIQYLTQNIPAINQDSSPKQYAKRVRGLRQNEQIIDLLKQYTFEMNKMFKNDVYYLQADFANPIKNMNSFVQAQQSLKLFLSKLTDEITIHWTKSEIQQIKKKLIWLRDACLDSTHVRECFQNMVTTIEYFIQTLGDEVQSKRNENDFKDVNGQILKISSAETTINQIQGIMLDSNKTNKIMNLIERTIDTDIIRHALQKITRKQVKKLIEHLFSLKDWVYSLPLINEKVHIRMISLLKTVKKQKLTNLLVSNLIQISNDKQNRIHATYAGQLLNRYQKQLTIQKVLPKLSMRIQDVIQKMKINSSHGKELLKNSYDLYSKTFQNLKEKYIAMSTPQRIASNLKLVKDQAKLTIISLLRISKKNIVSKQQIAILTAQLFIYVSIKRSAEQYYDAMASNITNPSIFQPHPIQVICILKFFGCDSEKSVYESLNFGEKGSSQIANQFMQIKTGEGKSIILAITSVMYALLGYKVSCACYSSYLSKRDYESYRDLFEDFNVTHLIQYGTLTEIFNNIINKDQILRNTVANLFLDAKDISQVKKIDKQQPIKTILILDEVDTFFGKDFYGNTYNPCKIIQDKNILSIIKLIWEKRSLQSQKILDLVKNSNFFTEISNKYKDVFSKFSRQFKKMIEDVKLLDSKEYIVKDNKIGYRELDGYSFNIVDGYKTMFLHIYEREKGNISEEAQKSIMGINITCGSYSYAEMIFNFDKILGVTGTLDCFTQFQQEILIKYNITEKSFAPSVYGKTNRIDNPILINDCQSDHYLAISICIKRNIQLGIPCLVFFQNQDKILKFISSDYMEHFIDNFGMITEKTEQSHRDLLIQKATVSKTLTLLTASFGRGTDFVVCDPLVKEKGVVVIQTFMSQNKSEELQIMGRTARNGLHGSYHLILNQELLEKKYKIKKDQILKAQQSMTFNVRNLIDEKRNQKLKILDQEREQIVELVKQKHYESMEKRIKVLSKYLSRKDSWFFMGSNTSSLARIAIMIDSTGSMSSVIQAVKGRVMDMIDKLNKSHPHQFEVQIMFYYGHNAYSKQSKEGEIWSKKNKIHASSWTSNINALQQFLKGSKAEGGSSHEAIELALHHLLVEHEFYGVSKAILIGDAGLPELEKSQIDYVIDPSDKYRYLDLGEEEKITLKFGQLLEQLKLSGISVDTYPIKTAIKIVETYSLISMCSKGEVKNFDPEKDDLADRIELVIKNEILMKR